MSGQTHAIAEEIRQRRLVDKRTALLAACALLLLAAATLVLPHWPAKQASLSVVLLLILGAEFVNGWTDAPNAIATVVGTRSLSPRAALAMASVFNLLGVMSGTAVAATIGKGIIDPAAVSLSTVGAAMAGIILWSGAAARWGIPTSESHALVAGLAGAALASAGPSALFWEGWQKVLIGLALSSLAGFAAGLFLMLAVSWLCRDVAPAKAGGSFRWLQVCSASFMAFSHGSNDGQKFIGAFVLALLLGGAVPEFHIPLWVIFLCAGVMAMGTAVGGWRIVRKLGSGLTRLKTHQGFAAETAAAATITLASSFGIPLSTTHTISTAIMGTGAARGFHAIRWRVTREMATAWLLTFPVCGVLGWLAVQAMSLLR